MNREDMNQGGTVCPACKALLVSINVCPDPGVHSNTVERQSSPPAIRLHGGQQPPNRSFYERDARGRAIMTFKGRDGTVRQYPVLWGWHDPVTGISIPYMIDLAVLEADDLLCITGMGKRAFEAISAHLPGRIPGRYTVACETTQFMREFFFGHLVALGNWSRVSRSQKAKRHRPGCPPRCRRSHPAGA